MIVVVSSERKLFDYDPEKMVERLRIGAVIVEFVGLGYNSRTTVLSRDPTSLAIARSGFQVPRNQN